MEHVPVKSSFIQSVGHEGTTLEVRLQNGKTYRCDAEISPIMHNEFLSAQSIGQHFHKIIKPLGMTLVDDNEALRKAAAGSDDGQK